MPVNPALATPCLSPTLSTKTFLCIFQPDEPFNNWATPTTEQLYVIECWGFSLILWAVSLVKFLQDSTWLGEKSWKITEHFQTNILTTGFSLKTQWKTFKGVRDYMLEKKGTNTHLLHVLERSHFLFWIKNKHWLSL